MSERAWLVEWRFNGVQWLYLWASAPGGFSFTGDASKALRFARREDAEAALQWARDTDAARRPIGSLTRHGLALGEMLVTEHDWPTFTAAPSAQPADDLAMQLLRTDFKRECDDTDMILRMLGLDPENCRTDGGSLKTNMILDALEARDRLIRRTAALTAAPSAQAEPRIDPLQNPMRPAYFMNYAKDETQAEMVLRKLACWLGVGGCNAPTVDADLFHRKIVDGIESLLAAARTMPATAQAEPRKGRRYEAGDWSMRNYEAWLEDQQEQP